MSSQIKRYSPSHTTSELLPLPPFQGFPVPSSPFFLGSSQEPIAQEPIAIDASTQIILSTVEALSPLTIAAQLTTARKQAIFELYKRTYQLHLRLMTSGGDVTKFTAFFLSCLLPDKFEANLAIPRVQDDGETLYFCYYCDVLLPKCVGEEISKLRDHFYSEKCDAKRVKPNLLAERKLAIEYFKAFRDLNREKQMMAKAKAKSRKRKLDAGLDRTDDSETDRGTKRARVQS